MSERSDIEAELAQHRRALSEAVAALRAKLTPGGLTSDLLGRAKAAAEPRPAALAEAARFAPALRAAGSAVRANPLASALAGAGLAWLAWGGIRRANAKRRETRPQWLIDAGTLRDEARRLREKVSAAKADGSLPERDAADSLAEIETVLAAETRRLMGQGLDGLEDEARAAALAAREAAWKREFRNSGGIGKTLTAGTALAGIGGLVTLMLTRKTPAEAAVSEAEDAAGAAIATARRILGEEAERLTAIATGLGDSLRAILNTAPADDTGPEDAAEPETEDPENRAG